MKTEYDCKACGGRGSNYGQFCPSCNGTGIAGNPRLGCLLIIAVSVVTTVAPLAYFYWPW